MSLVLTRREGEEVVVGDGHGGELMRVRVAEIRGDRVRLAFEAPLSVAVHRAEVWDQILAEKAGDKAA